MRQRAAGVISLIWAYGLWGFMPLYFLLLVPSGPWEIVAWRVLFSLVVCAAMLTIVRGGWRRAVDIGRRPRLLLLTALAGVLIYINWQSYLFAALTGRVLETSLGYFINPIVTVLLSVVVMGERLRPVQWGAIGVATSAVTIIVVGYGTVPWIAFILAGSFGLYGLVKSRIGGAVDAVSGLAWETVWLTPIAIAQLVVVGMTTGLTLGSASVAHTVLLACVGIATTAPLLLFAAGARRVPLSVVGMVQFIAPLLQFIIGVWVLHEPMPTERWWGFVLVWVALIMLTLDSLQAARRRARE